MTKKFLLLVALAATMLHGNAQTQKDSGAMQPDSFFKPVKWRNIGPFRGGRSGAASGVVGDKATYYMGTTGGGLWKTDDMGINWANISDGFFKTGSVGAVAVAESDPNVVYVGMGEHAVRGVMTHHGDGVYKSTDAGKTWKKMGLDSTQHIARIVIHPTDPNTVFVAAQGAFIRQIATKRHFQIHRRRRYLEKRAVHRRQNRLRGIVDGHEQSAYPLCRYVGTRPLALESHQRRPRQRTV
jgi:hypothetical protein